MYESNHEIKPSILTITFLTFPICLSVCFPPLRSPICKTAFSAIALVAASSSGRDEAIVLLVSNQNVPSLIILVHLSGRNLPINSRGTLASFSAHFVLSSSKACFLFQGSSRTMTSQICSVPLQVPSMVQLLPSSRVSIY